MEVGDFIVNSMFSIARIFPSEWNKINSKTEISAGIKWGKSFVGLDILSLCVAYSEKKGPTRRLKGLTLPYHKVRKV